MNRPSKGGRYGKYAFYNTAFPNTNSIARFNCLTQSQAAETGFLLEEENDMRRFMGSPPHPLRQVTGRNITEANVTGSLDIRAKCVEFGFTADTPEMANCLLELYKIENQPQQNTVITAPDPTPATNNSQDLYQSLDLLNRGIELINGTGNQSAPINSTSRCRRMGDTSGQVYTFSRIGCPVGYAPAL